MTLFSQVYRFFANLHRALYYTGFNRKIHLRKKVISVGNLTFGGTGKTPFVKKLVEDLISLGLKPAIVTKSYKAQSLTSELLTSEHVKQPQLWGDEACWYFHHVPVPVYSGPTKWESALLADQNPQVNCIVLDDGFQHHRLHRDLDIVLIDAVAGLKDLQQRARESISTLKFADVLVLSKSNLVEAEILEELRDALPKNKATFLSLTEVLKLYDKNGRAQTSLAGLKVGLVSGIANPHSFVTLFQKTYPNVETVTMQFSDHHQYQPADMLKIQKFCVDQKLDFIVMTEKDEIKIKELYHCNPSLKWSTDDFGYRVLQIETRLQDQDQWLKYLKDFL